jgi:hypothetical protein
MSAKYLRRTQSERAWNQFPHLAETVLGNGGFGRGATGGGILGGSVQVGVLLLGELVEVAVEACGDVRSIRFESRMDLRTDFCSSAPERALVTAGTVSRLWAVRRCFLRLLVLANFSFCNSVSTS